MVLCTLMYSEYMQKKKITEPIFQIATSSGLLNSPELRRFNILRFRLCLINTQIETRVTMVHRGTNIKIAIIKASLLPMGSDLQMYIYIDILMEIVLTSKAH